MVELYHVTLIKYNYVFHARQYNSEKHKIQRIYIFYGVLFDLNSHYSLALK